MGAITVLGYYSKSNLGDDLFESIFRYVIERRLCKRVHILNPASTNVLPADTALVVCGGGDLFNDYFLSRIMTILENSAFFTTNRVPLYAVGVGMQYPSMVQDTNKLDIFDRFYVRNKSDATVLASKYGSDSVAFIDDLVFHQPLLEQTLNIVNCPKQISKIGIALANSIAHNNARYPLLLKKLASIVSVLQHSADVYLIPFNTSPQSSPESDYNINNDLYAALADTTNVTNCADASEFTQMDLIVCSRYHAHVLAIRHCIPLLSLTHTRKARQLMYDNYLDDFMCPFATDANGVPVDIDEFRAIKMIRTLNLRRVCTKLVNAMDRIRNNTAVVNNLLYDLQRPCLRTSGPRYTSDRVTDLKVTGVIQTLARFLGAKEATAAAVLHELRTRPDAVVDMCVKLISYGITGVVNSNYNWGLRAKILLPDVDLVRELRWIVRDFIPDELPVAPIQRLPQHQVFDVAVNVNHAMQGRHRSGWAYVTNLLRDYTSPRDGHVLLDSFTDATFNVNDEVLSYLAVLPFKRDWIGFVHHTPNTSYSKNNVVELFKNAQFQESLKKCRALVVLSKYLRKWVCAVVPDIPVYYVCHPTETPTVVFDYDRFQLNRYKKVVQVGGWMRNSYGIYQLEIPEHTNLQKCALKGIAMDSYFKPEWFDPAKDVACLEYAYLHPSDDNSGNGGNGHCGHCDGNDGHSGGGNNNDGHCGCNGHSTCVCYNKYVSGLLAYLRTFAYDQVFVRGANGTLQLTSFILDELRTNDQSVQVLEHLSDSEYDLLLGQNIVFLDLIDASAVNTLVECVVRNTPLLVNRLPAIEEILGSDYPLYYSSYRDAKNKLCDMAVTVPAAHNYLSRIDKSRFSAAVFQWEIESIINVARLRV